MSEKRGHSNPLICGHSYPFLTIAEEGKRLHDRLLTYAAHLSNLGNSLGKAVEHYNKSMGSFERRVMPSARRFNEMGVSSGQLDLPQTIETQPRLPANSEDNDRESATQEVKADEPETETAV